MNPSRNKDERNNLEQWDCIRQMEHPIKEHPTDEEVAALYRMFLHPEEFNYLRDW